MPADTHVLDAGWHTTFDGGVRWRCVPRGVEIEGSGIERTPGEPATVRRIWRDLTKIFTHWSTALAIPVELLLATAATESRGYTRALRLEPGYLSDETTPDKVSPGIMQTLISTARDVLSLPVTRHDLFDPNVSVHAGAKYIRRQAKVTGLDPILTACAFNAGGIYHQDGRENRFKLRCFPLGSSAHADRFVSLFNDAVSMIAAEPAPPLCTWPRFLTGEATGA